MDNFHFDMTSEGDLTPAMKIAFGSHKFAEGYVIHKDAGLVFLWYWNHNYPVDGAVKWPFKMDATGAADFAKRWLSEQDYGKEPDHDGDNGKGWRLYNERWGQIQSISGSFIAVKPEWAMYGK